MGRGGTYNNGDSDTEGERRDIDKISGEGAEAGDLAVDLAHLVECVFLAVIANFTSLFSRRMFFDPAASKRVTMFASGGRLFGKTCAGSITREWGRAILPAFAIVHVRHWDVYGCVSCLLHIGRTAVIGNGREALTRKAVT